MSKFNKRETIVVRNRHEYDDDGIAAIYVHRETGLTVGVSHNHYIFDDSWIEATARPEMDILKHVWVEAWDSGETAQYWVGDIDDIQQLKELLEETEVSSVTVTVSADFIEAALEVL